MDLEAIVASGLFEECAAAIEAVFAGGTEQLHDVGTWNLVSSLRVVLLCRTQPGCEARIRSMATALEFCTQHDLACAEEIGTTTATFAAQIGEPLQRPKCHLRANQQIMHPLWVSWRFSMQCAQCSAAMRMRPALRFASRSRSRTC